MGEERERIPELVSWRGQQQDHRKVKGLADSVWALCPARAGRGGQRGTNRVLVLIALLWSLRVPPQLWDMAYHPLMAAPPGQDFAETSLNAANPLISKY